LQDVFAAAAEVAKPFDLKVDGRAIVTSITNPNDDGTTIAWQRQSPHGIDVTSEIGAAGDTPTLPNDFAVSANENIIAAECFFNFEPIIGFIIRGEQHIYTRAFQRPRLGTLDVIQP
jgi:hypothetical protein